MEFRLYAEDPENNFYPGIFLINVSASGKIHYWRPSTLEYARYDSGIQTG